MSMPAESLPASPLGLATRFTAALSALLRAIVALVRALNHRGDVQNLLEMDERCLKDIGLTRNDVLGALAEPLAKDPSRILLLRSLERRARQHPMVMARTASGVPACRV